MTLSDHDAARALLAWYVEMGVNEAVSAEPTDFYAFDAAGDHAPASPRPRRARPAAAAPETNARASVPPETPAPMPADEAIRAAEEAARAADSFEALEAAVEAFDGCALRAGASRTVFADGAPDADLLVIGEAPGRDEDRIGKPFVGRAGQLLDRMLAAIDRRREDNVLISNVIYWRPPGNRTPTPVETAVCRPFAERLIEITAPKVVVLAGGAPLQALLGVTGIMRARGVWRDLQTASGFRVPALPIFHPAFLLRQPAHKRLAWADLLAVEARLRQG